MATTPLDVCRAGVDMVSTFITLSMGGGERRGKLASGMGFITGVGEGSPY